MQGTAFERIRDHWMPTFLKGFERKNRDYNSANGEWENHKVLGVKGQFADLWRKVGKLKKNLWDGETLEGEQASEIIMDLIAHLFLTYDLLLEQEEAKADAARPLGVDAWNFSVAATQTGEEDQEVGIGFCGLDCKEGHTYVGPCLLRIGKANRSAG